MTTTREPRPGRPAAPNTGGGEKTSVLLTSFNQTERLVQSCSDFLGQLNTECPVSGPPPGVTTTKGLDLIASAAPV